MRGWNECAPAAEAGKRTPRAVSVFAALGTILIFSPGALIAVIPLGFLFVKIAHLFTIAGREMKRLESLAFSPILSHLGESLQV